jgi:hypothetical protein
MAGIIDNVKKIFKHSAKKNHIVFIVFDSCRYDAYMAAKTPNLDRIAKPDLRYSYASWTSPSHYTFLMGMVPHSSPKGVFASNVYRDEFRLWADRLHMPVEEVEFKNFVPQLSLPHFLKAHTARGG